MRSRYFLWMTMLILCAAPFSLASSLNLGEHGFLLDDETPGVTARVARISFMRGEVQIKRLDQEEWEKATLNLPLVEGDTISTGPGSRVEIQFDTRSHLRLDEDAFARILKLRNEGIAISVAEGTASLRLLEFDKDRSYFEIDAPSTTLAIQRAGLYRIDAGRQGDDEIRLTALDSGEARVYSDNSGFTLKNGRTVRVFIAGDRSGEWDTDRAAAIGDAFDAWSLERDEVIASRLKDAHYDTYYDRDIYAADELNENGTWIHKRKYGYVWRPNAQATNTYADWSPYRYGTWRWVPYYGWSWVNDEAWGWATYHHGRWLFDDGHWQWSPYGYYRHARSWWRPALVVFGYYGNTYCWYPLPYQYAYYNYNNYVVNNTTIINNYGPTATPTPGVVAAPDATNIAKPRRMPPIDVIPASAVVAMDARELGRGTKPRRAPLAAAQAILTKAPDERQMSVKLPVVKDLDGRLNASIRASEPANVRRAAPIKTGAAIRSNDSPLDESLRTQRIFGNRPPAVRTPNVDTSRGNVRSTGAVDRLPDSGGGVSPVRSAPTVSPSTRTTRDSPIYSPPSATRERPRQDQPPVRQEPPTRYDPPVRTQPPPEREKPRDNPPPPPVRSEPKPEAKPAPLERAPDRKKDGR